MQGFELGAPATALLGLGGAGAHAGVAARVRKVLVDERWRGAREARPASGKQAPHSASQWGAAPDVQEPTVGRLAGRVTGAEAALLCGHLLRVQRMHARMYKRRAQRGSANLCRLAGVCPAVQSLVFVESRAGVRKAQTGLTNDVQLAGLCGVRAGRRSSSSGGTGVRRSLQRGARRHPPTPPD